MKNIKLRIVYLILGAALLLFALFMLAVNLIIPAHFVREAKKALISEAEYQNRAIPYTYDEPDYDENWEEGYFFTPSIVFLELEDGYRHNTWNRDTYRLEKKLLEYCAGRDIALNQCYTFKTDKHHLIFMSVQEEQDDWEKPYAYIMYIDIGPITRYIVTLNWAFFAVLLAISSVMCLLGFRFGRNIEKEAERQQTFFQNASHELKTPLGGSSLPFPRWMFGSCSTTAYAPWSRQPPPAASPSCRTSPRNPLWSNAMTRRCVGRSRIS